MASNKIKRYLVACTVLSYRFLTRNKLQTSFDIESKEVSRIAIFSTTALGDLMFNTPAIIAIKKCYPHALVTLVSSDKNRELVGDSSWFNTVVYWNQKIQGVLRVSLKLHKFKPDIVVLLHSKSPYDILCATFSGAPFVLKDAYNADDFALKNYVSYLPDCHFNGHVIERKLSLVEKIGCSVNNIDMKIPCSIKSKGNKEKITIGFQMGASSKERQWPVKKFTNLARLLLSFDERFEIVLTGSPAEKYLSDCFISSLPDINACRIKNTVGENTLKELVNVIAGFDLLVTGDTGPLHLAISLRVKTVSLFVTSDPKYTGPLQDSELHTVIYKPLNPSNELSNIDEQPMSIINEDEVFLAILKLVKLISC